jgi:hypothetical protein
MTARNPYKMPFIIPVDDFARRCARAIEARRSSVVIPWKMAIAGRILSVLPDALFDALAARSGRKPRNY